MNKFDEYIKQVNIQLTCNAPVNCEFITYNYSEQQVKDNLEYFSNCMKSGLSAYKALLFFGDFLEEKQ